VDHADAGQAPGAGAGPAELRDGDPPGVADQDPLETVRSVDQDADLAADLARQLGEVASEFVGDDLVRRDPPAEDPLEVLDLRGLEAKGVAVDLVDCRDTSGNDRRRSEGPLTVTLRRAGCKPWHGTRMPGRPGGANP
jgi:hypothetical protein